MAKLEAGQRWRSSVCETEVIVITAGDAEITLTCGGAPMIDAAEGVATGGAVSTDAAQGTQLGKRYVDAAGSAELLCTKPGEGSLAIDGAPLQLKGAKPLPSSD